MECLILVVLMNITFNNEAFNFTTKIQSTNICNCLTAFICTPQNWRMCAGCFGKPSRVAVSIFWKKWKFECRAKRLPARNSFTFAKLAHFQRLPHFGALTPHFRTTLSRRLRSSPCCRSGSPSSLLLGLSMVVISINPDGLLRLFPAAMVVFPP